MTRPGAGRPTKGGKAGGGGRGAGAGGRTRDGAGSGAPKSRGAEPRGKSGAPKRGGKPEVRSVDPSTRSGKPVRPAPRPTSDEADARRLSGGRPKTKRPPRPEGPVTSRAGSTVKAESEGPMRVQRALARAGVVSRREADRAVAEGRVSVNGNVAQVGQVIDPNTDRVTLDDKPVNTRITAHHWIVLHKPAATMTTRKDPAGRQTVFDLVDDVPGLVYVGRLDFMTEGVLLLTTDGRAAHALTHPSSEVDRTYVATVRGDAVTAAREARRGVRLEDGLVVPKDVVASPLGNRRWAFEITIAEGKTHEVRRICDALGLEVERLVRISFGPVRLNDLPPGMARAVTAKEREILDALISAQA